MRKFSQLFSFQILIGLCFFLVVTATACGGNSEPYLETFDSAGTWRVEDGSDVQGTVQNGVYDFLIRADEITTWTTAGETFTDGYFEVEATQVGGPNNNAFGFIFRVDAETNNFYTFLISGDGYAWIGRYKNGGMEEAQPIVGEWWLETPVINQGEGVTNTLAVAAEGANLIFHINNQEIGRVTDDSFRSGDIGLIVRSLGRGDVHIQFDNFSVTPLE